MRRLLFERLQWQNDDRNIRDGWVGTAGQEAPVENHGVRLEVSGHPLGVLEALGETDELDRVWRKSFEKVLRSSALPCEQNSHCKALAVSDAPPGCRSRRPSAGQTGPLTIAPSVRVCVEAALSGRGRSDATDKGTGFAPGGLGARSWPRTTRPVRAF